MARPGRVIPGLLVVAAAVTVVATGAAGAVPPSTDPPATEPPATEPPVTVAPTTAPIVGLVTLEAIPECRSGLSVLVFRVTTNVALDHAEITVTGSAIGGEAVTGSGQMTAGGVFETEFVANEGGDYAAVWRPFRASRDSTPVSPCRTRHKASAAAQVDDGRAAGPQQVVGRDGEDVGPRAGRRPHDVVQQQVRVDEHAATPWRDRTAARRRSGSRWRRARRRHRLVSRSPHRRRRRAWPRRAGCDH